MIKTYIEAINEALFEEMDRDENVFLLGEDIGRLGGAFKATAGLFDKFGGMRVLDTPISESLIVGASIGAALLGMRPVAEMQFADFISCAFDQIVNMAATMRYRNGGRVSLPLVIRAPSGAGIHGGLFHSQNPESFFLSTPGLKLVAPSNPYDAKGLLKAAIRDNNPVIFFEHKNLYRRLKEDIPEEEYIVELGKARKVLTGNDMTIVTYGFSVHQCVEAAGILKKEGVGVEVIDLRTLMPLDEAMILESVKKTGKVMIVHEDRVRSGLGAEISAIISESLFDYLDGPVMRVGSANTHYGFAPTLEEFIIPNTEKILATARKLAEY